MGRAPHEGIGLERIVRDVKAELNPDGGGYHTSEAADLVFERARRGCGFLTAPMRELARAGAVVKLKEYANETAATNPRLSMARAAAAAGQNDFADISEGFGWMDGETALDEGVHAIRKLYRDLTYSEAVRVIELKRKKARETDAIANMLQSIIDRYPNWAGRPRQTMGEIIGLT